MDIMVLVNQLIQLFLLMGLGYFIYKIKIMDADFNKKLTNFVLKVTMPCMIIASVFDVSEDRDFSKIYITFAVAIVMYLVLPIVGIVVAKIIRCKPENTGIYVFMTIYSNISFMGFPVVESLLGTQALFYAAIFCLIFNITCFSIGVKVINYPQKAGSKTSAKDVFLHPGVWSALFAIVIYFINPTIPQVIAGPITSVGKLTSSLAMILMGAALAKVPAKQVINEVRPYVFLVIKQVIIPILVWPLLKLLIKDPTILGVTIINLTLPIANMVVMFAIEYDRNEELAAKNVFLSTLASIVLMPLVLYVTYLR